jgi:hypothetical protein
MGLGRVNNVLDRGANLRLMRGVGEWIVQKGGKAEITLHLEGMCNIKCSTVRSRDWEG